MLKRHLSKETAETLLRQELLPAETDTVKKNKLLSIFKVRKNER